MKQQLIKIKGLSTISNVRQSYYGYTYNGKIIDKGNSGLLFIRYLRTIAIYKDD